LPDTTQYCGSHLGINDLFVYQHRADETRLSSVIGPGLREPFREGLAGTAAGPNT
jgi:hypothetical protein